MKNAERSFQAGSNRQTHERLEMGLKKSTGVKMRCVQDCLKNKSHEVNDCGEWQEMCMDWI